MAAHIPRFTSFRPKPKPAAGAHEPAEEAKRESKSTSNHESKSKSNSTHDANVTSKDKAPPYATSQQDPSSKLYFSDRRGDANVLRYGTLDRYNIPAYRRFGHGYVLGLSPDYKIDRQQSTSTAICIAPTRKRQQRLLTDNRLNKSTHRALRLVHNSHNAQTFNDDFISLTATTSPRNRSHVDDEEAPQLDYRDIQPRRKPDEPLDPDTHYESDRDLVIDTEITKKNALLARRTKENPRHVQSWLDLIEHQEAMLKLERPSDALTASDKAHLADVRISIYEEALKKATTNQNSESRLWQGLLTEASIVWDDAKLASKWKQVLAKHSHNTDLWWLYLDSMQGGFAKFKFENCRLAFLSCVDTLRSSTAIIPLETYSHLLIRLTSMIYDCGYQELALAIWQAILEFHLMRPDDNDDTVLLSGFEEFWESEAPRVGEPGAKGWKNHHALDAQPSGPAPLVEAGPLPNALGDFQRREMDAMRKLQYPGRMSDDVGEDDAFHTILFSDIEAYLNIVPSMTSAALLVEAFLCFCGLPPLTQHTAREQEWWSDPFLPHQSARLPRSESKAAQRLHTLGDDSNLPSQGFKMTTKLLFEHSFTLRADRLDLGLPRRLLQLIASSRPDHDIIGEYLLAFESRHFPACAPKTAKQLLQTNPSSLRLYNAYGLVELKRGNPDKANQVFSMALSLQKDKFALSKRESLQLYHEWVWQALRHGDQRQALWRLLSPNGKIPGQASSDTSPSREVLLQMRLLLSERSERGLLDAEFEVAVLSTSLLALVVYLSNDSKIESALDIHQGLLAWMVSHKMSHSMYAELHAQYMADFLAYHITHATIVKPALIRTTLEPLIACFPNNTILLSLYARNEARFSIDDRVRGILRSNALQGSKETNVDGWTFAIYYEMLRGQVAGSTSHSIRALYQRATSAKGQHCLDLWVAYLRFELMQLHGEQATMSKRSRKESGKDYHTDWLHKARQRIRETFHNGLAHLPWCKDFIMLPFSTEFDGVFEDEEKWKFYRIMHEKEMRVYIELDEAGM